MTIIQKATAKQIEKIKEINNSLEQDLLLDYYFKKIFVINSHLYEYYFLRWQRPEQ